MKKHFILAAAALAAMASCQQSSMIEILPAEEKSPIDFSAYTKTAVTKGTIVTGAEVESIGVFAFYQQNSNGAAVNFNTHKFGTPDYMYNQKVTSTYDASAKKFGKWTYDPLKYWPNNKGDQLSFFAYAPYDANKTWEDMGISTDANGSKMEVSFPIYDDVKDQIDYLWANPQVNKGNASAGGSATVAGSDSTVKFAFSHITSQLSLYVGVECDSTKLKPGKWTDANTTITVEKVEFKGLGDKIALKYTMPIYASDDPVKTVSGSQNIVLSKEGNNFRNEVINNTTYASVPDTLNGYRPLLAQEKNSKGENEDGYMFLAPQDLTNAEMVFEYKVETKDAANPANNSTIVNTITRKWSQIVDAALTTIEAGKAYRLNILIGMNSVVIEASETAWEDATTHRIDVPANQ